MKRVPLHSSAFLKPPLISHRSSSTEGGMGMKWSRWTLAGVQGWKGGQFVGQCWWDTRRSEGLAHILGTWSSSPSPITDETCASLSVFLCPLILLETMPQKASLKTQGDRNKTKIFRIGGGEKKGCEILNLTRSHWNEVFSFWIFLGLLKYTSGRITAPLYVSVISRLEDLQKTFLQCPRKVYRIV